MLIKDKIIFLIIPSTKNKNRIIFGQKFLPQSFNKGSVKNERDASMKSERVDALCIYEIR